MIRDYFNEKAEDWDGYAAERDAGRLERMVEKLGLKSGMIILDIGTGTGIFLPYILKKIGYNGRVIALDIAQKMLLQAQRKGFKGEIDFLCADVENIPLQADTCDAVVCYSSFPHFQDKIRAFREMRRVLKKSGCVFICHTSGREAINNIHASIALLRHDLLPDENNMKALLRKTGFTGIICEDATDSYLARGRKPD